MTATVNGRPVSREKVAEIVADLAKGFRKPDDIAKRHHVPVGLVVELRQAHGGNDLRQLADSAERLRRPARRAVPTQEAADLVAEVSGVRPPVAEADASNVVPKPEADAQTPKPESCKVAKRGGARDDGLTADERRAAKDWIEAEDGNRPAGPLSRANVERWREAGRAADLDAMIADSAPDESQRDDLAELRDALAVEAEATAAERDTQPTPHDDVTDAEIPPEPPEGLDAVTAALDYDWELLYAECLEIPALTVECRAVADAVEMLRDALAEHEHREAMVGQIVAQLADFDGSPDSAARIARRILDQIEVAA